VEKETGLVQVYTGDGKGKTTAALGIALRAIGRGLRVVFVQFMKESPMGTGELETAERLAPDLVVKQFDGNFLGGVTPEKVKEVKEGVEKGFQFVREAMAKRTCDILVLDEISHVMNFMVMEVKDVLKLIDEKPPDMELILTGRDMPKEILERADLVTEMRKIKHPFEKGAIARRGIEY
jgi:cob(I)alamin adenosyltransferase